MELKQNAMIELNEALDILKQSAVLCGTENVSLEKSMHRILAAEVISDTHVPAFNKSAMDGFACRAIDVDLPLEIIDTVTAGKNPNKTITKGTCAKIMTGAMIPEGADVVIKVEDTTLQDGKVVFKGDLKNANIRFIGEECNQGSVLIPSGSLIKPQHIAVMASVGMVNPSVYKQPKVAVISTGDELVEPDVVPETARIRNSNAIQLLNQLKMIGVEGSYCGIATDNKDAIHRKIVDAQNNHDVILISGGVSMGDYDFVPEVLKEEGFEFVFQKINVKPGKPVLFARKQNIYCFGMPGNPVSSFIQYELIVKPFLYALQGYDYHELKVPLTMGNDFSAQGLQQIRFIPITIHNYQTVEPLFYKGSAHIGAIAQADGLLELPKGKGQLKKGETVYVRLL